MAKLRTRRKKVLTEAPEEGRVRFSAAQSDPEAAKRILGEDPKLEKTENERLRRLLDVQPFVSDL